MKRVNLTMHPALPEQECAARSEEFGWEVKAALTFKALPPQEEIEERAERLADLAAQEGAVEAMIGGAPYLMAPLEKALWEQGVRPVYAFSVRESREIEKDGRVSKVSVFRHLGFVKAWRN